MPTREEMRSLAEDIVGSYADRIAGVAQIKQDESERKRTSAQEISQRKSDVGTMLKEFDKEHAAMSQELRTKLASDEQERHQTTAQEIAQRKSNVSTMLREFHEEQAGVRDEWQTLSATMQAQRVGAAVEMGPTEAVAVPAEEMIPETTDLGGRVFEYLANHPDGTRLVELEQEFGLARIQIAKIVKSLMDENKVEKRDMLYFAI